MPVASGKEEVAICKGGVLTSCSISPQPAFSKNTAIQSIRSLPLFVQHNGTRPGPHSDFQHARVWHRYFLFCHPPNWISALHQENISVRLDSCSRTSKSYSAICIPYDDMQDVVASQCWPSRLMVLYRLPRSSRMLSMQLVSCYAFAVFPFRY